MIPKQIQVELVKKAKLTKYADNTYFKDSGSANFKYIKDKFFNGEKEDKIINLIVGSGIFSVIANKISQFVNQPSVTSDDIKFKASLPTTKRAKDVVSNNYALIGIKVIDGEYELIHIPVKSHYKTAQEEDATLTLYEVEDSDEKKYYGLTKIFRKGETESRLYQLENTKDLSSGKEVPLTTLSQTENIAPIEKTKLNVPALIIIGEDRSQSLLEIIEDRVLSMDRKRVMFETQYLQYVDSFVVFRNISIGEKSVAKMIKGDSPVDFSQIGRMFWTKDPNSGIEFANNVNPLLEKAEKSYESDLRYISSQTDVPIEFFGIETHDGAIGEGSRWMKNSAFIQRIEKIRDAIDESIEHIKANIIALGDISYTRPDIVPQSNIDRVNEIVVAKDNGLISHKKAIMEYHGYSEDDAQSELEEILSTDSDTGNTPE